MARQTTGDVAECLTTDLDLQRPPVNNLRGQSAQTVLTLKITYVRVLIILAEIQTGINMKTCWKYGRKSCKKIPGIRVHEENRNVSTLIKLLIDQRRFEWRLNRRIGVNS
jgi:hypothetical protein